MTTGAGRGILLAHSVLKGDTAMAGEGQRIHDEMSGQIVEAAAGIALREGAGEVTVRKIIRALGVTNRVFYNRFRNAEEVLSLVYQGMAVKMRQSVLDSFDPEGDFWGQITDIAAGTLRLSYRLKLGMNQYVFIQDSVSAENHLWWRERIGGFIDLGKEKGLVRPELDRDIISYAIWCFIRGYNTDALARALPEEEAVRGLRYFFGVLLDGMKAK